MWRADVAAECEYGRVAFEMKTVRRNDLTIAAIAFRLGDNTDVHDGPRPECRNWAEPV